MSTETVHGLITERCARESGSDIAPILYSLGWNSLAKITPPNRDVRHPTWQASRTKSWPSIGVAARSSCPSEFEGNDV